MIISLYAHGMTVRDILHHLEQVYGTKLSAEMVSRITDQVLEHQDLRILDGITARQQHQPAEHPDHEQVDETDKHKHRA